MRMTGWVIRGSSNIPNCILIYMRWWGIRGSSNIPKLYTSVCEGAGDQGIQYHSKPFTLQSFQDQSFVGNGTKSRQKVVTLKVNAGGRQNLIMTSFYLIQDLLIKSVDDKSCKNFHSFVFSYKSDLSV